MTKIFTANCQGGVVTTEGLTLDADIVASGQGQSSGAVILEKDHAVYLPNTQPDLETTIEKLSESLGKLTEILAAIGAGMTGPTTAPPGTLATDLAEITALKAELDALKGNLI